MFVILKRSKDSKNYTVYHVLKAKNEKEAFNEAAEYLSDSGAPAIGDPEDVFEIAQIISNPLQARLSVIAATQLIKEQGKEIILRCLIDKKG